MAKKYTKLILASIITLLVFGTFIFLTGQNGKNSSNESVAENQDWVPVVVKDMRFSDTSLLTENDKSQILNKLSEKELVKATNVDDYFVEIVNIRREGDWVVATYELKDKKTKSTSGTGANTFLIFNKAGNNWETYSAGDEEFSTQLRLLPRSILSQQ